MPISLRLVFATTEDIHSTFLTTFIRRIPILVSLPDLQTAAAARKKRSRCSFSGRRPARCPPGCS
jgi:sigma-54 dependent transcriptional regulator of gfr operon